MPPATKGMTGEVKPDVIDGRKPRPGGALLGRCFIGPGVRSERLLDVVNADCSLAGAVDFGDAMTTDRRGVLADRPKVFERDRHNWATAIKNVPAKRARFCSGSVGGRAGGALSEGFGL